MNRARTVAGAALVLALLVLPPAISAGQDPAPAEETAPAPADTPPPAPAPPAPEDGSAAQGEGADAPKQEAARPAEAPSAPETTEVSASSAGVAPGARKSKLARAAADVSVSIGDNFYTPKTVNISVGDTVTWTNDGQAQHSATASNESFDTGVFGPGASRSHTFKRAGTFDYFCTIHGTSQSGTVKVAAASGGGGGGGRGGGGGAGAGPSEAKAVASAGAAGSSTSLPSTGSDALPPMVAGLLLLAGGFVLRLRDFIRPA